MTETQEGKLCLSGVKKTFGNTPDATRIDIKHLEIAAGSLVTIVGDSGSGKTTLLRLVAGLETPDTGSISIDGVDCTTVPPIRRGTPFIPQENSLLPHLSVAQNVAFPLGEQAAAPLEKHRIEVLLTTMNLTGISERYPAELSAGQLQRVAIARALVLRPRVLLLDEPTANLDPRSREQVRLDIKNTQRRLGMSVLLVTHDPVEAMSMGQQILVMHHGRIAGMGSPEEMYLHPTSVVSARALGDINLVSCQISARTKGSYQVTVLGQTVWVSGCVAAGATAAQLLLRPEQLRFTATSKTRENQVRGKVAVVLESEFCGANRNFLVETVHGTLKVRVPAAQYHFQPGDFVTLHFDARDAWLLP